MSSFRADDADDFAYVRAGVADRLLKADQALPRGVHLLLIEGYRPSARQRRSFDDYLHSLRRPARRVDGTGAGWWPGRHV